MVAIVAGLVLFGSNIRLPSPQSPQATQAPQARVPMIASASHELALVRAPDGHFYATAKVNGTDVRFLVDTGATSVVLTADDARRAGLGAGDYSATGRGASGPVRLRPVTLARLAVGPTATDNFPAMVAETLSVSLLGQTYLRQWREVTITGDRMVLR